MKIHGLNVPSHITMKRKSDDHVMALVFTDEQRAVYREATLKLLDIRPKYSLYEAFVHVNHYVCMMVSGAVFKAGTPQPEFLWDLAGAFSIESAASMKTATQEQIDAWDMNKAIEKLAASNPAVTIAKPKKHKRKRNPRRNGRP